MSNYVCIGVPYYLGESRPERQEVEALRRRGIADELGAEWVTIAPDFGAADDPVVAVNRALARSNRCPCRQGAGGLRVRLHQLPGHGERLGSQVAGDSLV